jgi:excinuclease ABC subunit C
VQLQISVPFKPDLDENSQLEAIPSIPAVFALFLDAPDAPKAPPYLGRTADLRRRLRRLLGLRSSLSKLLNLRELTRQIEYQPVGSPLEAQWLLYRLNKLHYPSTYRQRMRLRSPALLKVNLRNRFPRCYPTRRLSSDGSLYYGPFPSRLAAERFASEFLDLFNIRRCVEDLNPDPSHPGCIYSQMRMCLAPCFQGCTDEEYQEEVGRVVAFLDAEGQPLIRGLEADRARASEALDFEAAGKLHRRLEKVHEVLRQKPGLARNVRDLHAVIVERGAPPKSVCFFRLRGGEIHGPFLLSFDENVARPVPLDQQLHELLALPARPADSPLLPPWEHLSLLARWYYSSFRTGEILPLGPHQEIPHARLIRLCRKVLAQTPPS